MFRLVMAMAATISAVVFVMANTHHVKISFAFGSPVKVRLIFLLILTFVAGAVVTGIFSMISNVRFRYRVRHRVRKEAREQPERDEIDDEDLVAE